MKCRLAICLSVALLWPQPALAAAADEAACIAAPSEVCVRDLIAEATEWKSSAAAEASYYSDLGRSYGLAGRAAEAQGHFSQALTLAETIEDPEQQNRTLYWIGEWMLRVGDFQSAVAVFRRLPDSLGIPIPMNFGAWRLADAGEFELAFEMSSRLPHPSKRPDHLRHLAQGQAEAGDIVGAWRSFWAMLPGRVTTLEEVEALFEGRPEGLPVNVFLPLAAIAAAEVRAGNLDRALALERLPHQSSDTFPGVAAQIADALAESGRVDEAVKKVTTIESRRERNAALQMISERLAGKRAWARAVQIAGMIDIEEQALSAMLRLAELQADSGALSEATATYDAAMKDSTRFLRHLADDQLEATRIAIANALIRRGDLNSAEGYYDQVLVSLPWRNLDWQVPPLSSLLDVGELVGKVAVARYEAGDAAGAANLIAEAAALLDPDHVARNGDEKRLMRVAQNDPGRFAGSLVWLQARIGQPGPALATAMTIERPFERSAAFHAVLRAVLASRPE